MAFPHQEIQVEQVVLVEAAVAATQAQVAQEFFIFSTRRLQ
jgi:hypothetical protein